MNSLNPIRLVSRSERFLLALALMLGLALTFSSVEVAQAATIQVDDDGVECPGAYTTIQAAVNDASVGDTIEVCPGTYAEAVNVDESLTIVSTDGADDTTVVGGFRFATNDITLNGFTIAEGTTFGSSETGGVYIVGGTNGHEILNNIFTGLSVSIGIHVGTSGVVDALEIHGNTISDWTTGIYLNPGSGHNISNNSFTGNVAAIGTDGISDTNIIDNVFNDNGEAVGASGTGIVINDNDIENSNVSGVINYGTAEVNAECNWWGYASGPSGTDVVELNGNIDADPWQTAPDSACNGTEGGTESDPQTVEQCKDGGWMNFYENGQQRFKNQGKCIQFVNTGK